MRLRLSICSFSTLQSIWAVFREYWGWACCKSASTWWKEDRGHALHRTYEASVCKEFRNLPCSRFSLYTSELQKQNPKLLLCLTNTEKHCCKFGGIVRVLIHSLILPNIQFSEFTIYDKTNIYFSVQNTEKKYARSPFIYYTSISYQLLFFQAKDTLTHFSISCYLS